MPQSTHFVTQNGKAVQFPIQKGLTNFAPGWRKDRATQNPRAGQFVIRVREFDRCLIRVVAERQGGRFLGIYVTPKGVPVEECRGRRFKIDRWPLFTARKSR